VGYVGFVPPRPPETEPLRYMITNADIIALIRKVNPNAESKVVDGSSTLKGLGFDSLDRFNLLVELQELTGVEVPDEDVSQLESVDSIREYIAQRGG
jgi:acyl carrier protein